MTEPHTMHGEHLLDLGPSQSGVQILEPRSHLVVRVPLGSRKIRVGGLSRPSLRGRTQLTAAQNLRN